MSGALIFVTYASENGNNVTVSPRLGKNHVMPLHTSNVTVEVLNGSGIYDGIFVVNAQCTGCRHWDGGSIDVDSTSQDMIWAAGPTGSLKSNDLQESISQHDGHAFFNLDLRAATGVGGVPVPADASLEGGPVADGGRFRGGSAFHAFLMVAAFLIVSPGAVLVLRIFEKVWLHWAIQSLALVMICIGAGVGIAISKRHSIVSKKSEKLMVSSE